MLLLIASTVVALGTSFVCSMMEAMVLSVSPITLTSLSRKGDKQAGIMLDMKKNIGRPIAAILVLNTVANVGGATVAGAAFAHLYGPAMMWAFSVPFTLAVLFGTEIIPKVIGVSFSTKLATVGARPLMLVTRVLTPVIWVAESITRHFERRDQMGYVTTGDIVTLASLARSGKIIGLEQENIIINAVRLSHTLVKAAMIPRARVQYLQLGQTIESNLSRLPEPRHTRYPVCTGDDINTATGLVNVKKLLATHEEDAMLDASGVTGPLHYVAENATLLEAMRQMIQKRQHMTLVKDAKGNVSGLITIEDINSELLGYDFDQSV